jgi:hypothetical protein
MKAEHRSASTSSAYLECAPARRGSLWWCAFAAVLGCAGKPELDEYDVHVRFESDPERPVAGVELLLAGQVAGASNPDGVVELRATGREGQRIGYQVRCPPHHRSPEQPLVITLTTLSGAAPPPEYRVRCTPESRSVVIAVRAQRGDALPVTYLGREVARTDASGAAHLQVQLASSETIELTLDTSARTDLRPQNPSRRFETPERDAVLLFEQDFVVELPPPPPRERGIIRF